jgi:hypothetical protein
MKMLPFPPNLEKKRLSDHVREPFLHESPARARQHSPG